MRAPMPKTPDCRTCCTRYVLRAFAVLVFGLLPSLALAQGAIYGVVQNSDLSNPSTSDLYWVGFLDNTDEEIRIKTNTGAGYDGTNWFDDFQNYTTEVAGNPYDYFFVNVANGEGFHLENPIPSNSFQQENVQLAAGTFPGRPSGLTTTVASSSRINVSWIYQSGVTYHVYRRATTNNGVFRRLDDPTGSLSNAGVADSFFVDATSDGVSNYTYIIIGENGSGIWSAHSIEVAANAATSVAPTVLAVDPDSGSATGQPLVTVSGTNFDMGGVTVTFGGVAANNITVVSPFELTCNVPTGTPGFVNVIVTNAASGLASAPLVNGFRYLGNGAPVLTTPGNQSVDEAQNLNFAVSATDPDGDSVILSAENMPLNATFTDNFNGTGTFDFNPDYTQAGVYNVRFIASDGSLADTSIIAITVNDVNLRPQWSAISDQGVNEGANLNFGVAATDADGDSLILSAENLPANATFGDNFDGTGTFDFNPDFTQSGVYVIDFIASDGVLADTAQVTITVTENNRAPVWAAISAQNVDEGQNLNFGVSASDLDNDSLILSAENLPANATFNDNFDGTGTFDFNPDFTQAGVYVVDFIASDGVLADTQQVSITVNDINRTPTLAAIGAQSVDEGQNLNFNASGSDPDADSLIFSALDVPTNATFTDNFNGTATFDFGPDFSQAGSYNVTIIVSDGALADTEIVAITVNDINQTPALAVIGSQFVNEGQNLNLSITATDFDLDSLILSAENVPINATFADHFDGTATFDFNPDFTQSGVYNVTFIASDGVLADTEIVAITVNDAGNQAPVIATIPAQAVTEGTNLNFGVSASDVDLDSIILSAENMPVNATFSDNFDGTGTFDFNPDFTQAGVYNVDIIASDGVLADTEIVQITVNDGGNQAPVLASIGAQSVDEGANLNFGVSATDVDLDSLILSAVNVPANVVFTDNFNGTGTFDFNPDYTQAGVYNVDIIVSDGALADTETVQITVNDINRAPSVDAISPQVVDEGQNLNFGVSASDPDLDSLILSAENLPANATFNDNFDGTGTFDFNPDFTQAGVYNVDIIVNDGALADTLTFAITVNHVNLAPVLATIGPRNVLEGQNLNFGATATDFDGDSLILSAENLPVNATFSDNFDGSGTFDFNPDFTQEGVYNVTFIVSDGALADTEIVAITVNPAGNQRPVLASIGPKTTVEGQVLNFTISATDADSTIPGLFASGVPANASFADSGNGLGGFSFAPSFSQAGVYNVIFYASDGVLADTEIVAITVLEAGNQKPILDPIGPQTVDEGQTLELNVTATDPESNPIILSARNMPPNAAFADSGNGSGVFTFNPNFSQAATYSVRFIASDGALADTILVEVTVNDVNVAPVVADPGPQSTDEGQNFNLVVTASDFDGDSLIMSAVNVPFNATFADNFDGTGTFDFNPSYQQSGLYTVTFIASDGALSDTVLVDVTVNHVNLPPVLNAIGPQTVDEGQTLNFIVAGGDPDEDSVFFTADPVPANASLTDHGDGTADFTFTPDITQAGVYNITFVISDGALADTEIVVITVNDVNSAPVWTTIIDQIVAEGANLNFAVNASDPDLDSLILSAENLPANATFTDNFDGTGTFDFTPDFTQSGSYNVLFIASDGVLADTETVLIAVNESGNQAPVLAAIGDQTVDEGQNLNLIFSATDPDNDSLIITTTIRPQNSTYTDNGDGTAIFDFNPSFFQAGTHDLTIIASDGILADSESIVITVNNVNQVPVLAPIGNLTVVEGETLSVLITATDADGVIPSINASGLPAGAVFADSGNGTASLVYAPGYNEQGIYPFQVSASDGVDADTESVTVTVQDAGNQPPVLDSIGTLYVQEGDTLRYRITGSDPDGTTPVFTAVNLPPNATMVDSTNGAAGFVMPTMYGDGGTDYLVTFIASDVALADTEIVVVSVIDLGNLAPVFDPVADQVVDEGDTLILLVHAVDPEGGVITMGTIQSIENATFVDSGNGFGTFRYLPTYYQAGADTVKILAIDDGIPTASKTLVIPITTTEYNIAPDQLPIGDRTVLAGDSVKVRIVATDSTAPPGNVLTMTALNLPANATYVDSGNGIGGFKFKPTFAQIGSYNVTFITTDNGTPSLVDQETITINVQSQNRPPVLASIGPKQIYEGDTLIFNITATDPDSTVPFFTIDTLPMNATFVDSGNGVGTFTFMPAYFQAGLYSVKFTADDGNLTDNEQVLIQIKEAGNQPPVLQPVGDLSVVEKSTLTAVIAGFDPDATIPALSVDTLFENATFIDSGNGTGVYTITPQYWQDSVYTLTFIVDDGEFADSETVTLTIFDVGNQAPYFTDIDSTMQVKENVGNVMFSIAAADSDLTTPSLTARPLPAFASFADSGDGTGWFTFSPSTLDSGSYELYAVTMDAEDPGLADSVLVSLYVIDSNLAPLYGAKSWGSVGLMTLQPGQTGTIWLQATDPDQSIPKFELVSGLVNNMTFTDTDTGFAYLTFSPDFSQEGIASQYDVRFLAIDRFDPALTADDDVPFSFRVNPRPVPPILDSIGPKVIYEGNSLQFIATASDSNVKNPQPTVRVFDYPPNTTIDSTLGLGRVGFRFEPTFIQSGVYHILFQARDPSGLIDTERVSITVAEAGNRRPQWTSPFPEGLVRVGIPGDTTFSMWGNDLDDSVLTLSVTGAPWNATFVQDNDSMATFSFAPDSIQGDSIYNLDFIISDGLLADTVRVNLQAVPFTLGDVNFDGTINTVDMNYLIRHIFFNGPDPLPVAASGDVDKDGQINSVDLNFMIQYLFFNADWP